MVEFAIIKFFDTREGKNYGFAIVLDENGNRTKEEIFFHAGDRSLIDTGDDGTPVFTGTHRGLVRGRLRNMQLPSKGDRIVFERKPGKNSKPKACPWGYERSWIKTANSSHEDELSHMQAEWDQFVLDEEAKMAQQRLDEEESMIDNDVDDFDDRDDDICQGICGQPAYACTCAETEAFRQHNADPATRGSWFVA